MKKQTATDVIGSEWIHIVDFPPFLTREITLVTSGLLFSDQSPSEKGSTLKGRILSPWDSL